MTKNFLNISEEHLGKNASPAEAMRIVELLQADGWHVVYGDLPWHFADDTHRTRFEAAFDWALGVLQAEKSGSNTKKLKEFAEQRIRQNGRLQPFEDNLMQERPWAGYWRWLINSPTDVIVKWIQSDNKKDVPRK